MKSLDQAVEKFKILKQKLKHLSQQASNTPKIYLKNKQDDPSTITSHLPSNIVPKTINTINSKNELSNLHTHSNTNTQIGLNQNTRKNRVASDKENNQNIQNRVKPNINQKQKSVLNSSINFKSKNKLKSNKLGSFEFEEQKVESKNLTKKKIHHRKNNSWNYEINQPKILQVQNLNNNDHASLAGQFKSTSLNNSRISEIYTVELKQKQKTLYQINNLLDQKKQVLQALQKKIYSPIFQQNLNFEHLVNRGKKSIRAPNLFQMQIQGRKRSKSKQLTIRWK